MTRTSQNLTSVCESNLHHHFFDQDSSSSVSFILSNFCSNSSRLRLHLKIHKSKTWSFTYCLISNLSLVPIPSTPSSKAIEKFSIERKDARNFYSIFSAQFPSLNLEASPEDEGAINRERCIKDCRKHPQKMNINILKLEIYDRHNCFRVNYPLGLSFARAKVQKFIGSIFMCVYPRKNSQCLVKRKNKERSGGVGWRGKGLKSICRHIQPQCHQFPMYVACLLFFSSLLHLIHSQQ